MTRRKIYTYCYFVLSSFLMYQILSSPYEHLRDDKLLMFMIVVFWIISLYAQYFGRLINDKWKN